MSNTSKIKLLVVPDLFPEQSGDWTGVFVVDYIKAVMPWCEPTVFYSRLAGTAPGLRQEKFEDLFTVHRFVKQQKKPNLIAKLPAYKRWIKKSVMAANLLPKPDLIHAHGATLYGSLAVKLGRYWNVPVVISEHTGPFSTISKSSLKRRWAGKSMGSADLTLAVSAHLKNEILASGIAPKRVEVSGNPVDTNLFVPGSGGKTIAFVSRLDEFKGGLRTLKAFHQLLEAAPDWKLSIGGDGQELNAIEAYVQEHQLQSQVELLGRLTKPEIATLFQRSAFVVFPSRHESFGLIPAEAMSAGLPVIATNQTAPPEFIPNNSGILVNPESIDEILGAMKTMIARYGQFDRTVIRQQIVDRFGFEAFGQQLTAHYQQLLQDP